jgi:hypothetical protein
MHLNIVTESVQVAATGRSGVLSPKVQFNPSVRDSGRWNRRIGRSLRRPGALLFNLQSEINNLKSAIAPSATLRGTLLA